MKKKITEQQSTQSSRAERPPNGVIEDMCLSARISLRRDNNGENLSIPRFLLILLITLTSALPACGNTAPSRNSQQEEFSKSQASLDWLIARYGLIDNIALNRLLNRVTKHLAEGRSRHLFETRTKDLSSSDVHDPPWHVLVLNVAEPNAFSLRGGTLLLTKGAIISLHEEGELAAVLSHEMAHQILGHSTALETRGSRTQPPNFGPKAGTTSSDRSSTSPHFLFSLDNELAADSLGFRILEDAHYEPSSALVALTALYRPKERIVADETNDWMKERTNNLYRLLKNSRHFVGATRNSREFMRTRALLSQQ